MVLKELISDSFYFGRNSFLTVSTLEGCGHLEITEY